MQQPYTEFRTDVPGHTSYRMPDLVVFDQTVRARRGMEGAARLVIEFASPGDESLAKLPFYERVGVAEVLIIDRDTKVLRHWTRPRSRELSSRFADGRSAPPPLRAADRRPPTSDPPNGRHSAFTVPLVAAAPEGWSLSAAPQGWP